MAEPFLMFRYDVRHDAYGFYETTRADLIGSLTFSEVRQAGRLDCGLVRRVRNGWREMWDAHNNAVSVFENLPEQPMQWEIDRMLRDVGAL